ncbi:MAG TPA: hypothetical protein DHW49_07490 [Anaerolineae bacterium]|nr:hypothetical protein [Anaerolineae bacterium]
MSIETSKTFKILSSVIALILLASMFHWRASQNYKNADYYNSNFFVFWLSGKLMLDGESPYNPEDWSNGHEKYGTITPKEPTFLYPLPLVLFLTPLGFLSLGQAYYVWQIISQVIIGFVVYSLLSRWKSSAHSRLLIPIVVFLLYFGPIYLTLQIGSIGAISLLFLFGGLNFLDRKNLFIAGLLLSFTMLKPSQGVMILFLLGTFFLLTKQWKFIYGMIVGGILLLILGIALNPNWVSIFINSSQAAFDRRLGVQSNVWSFSYLACNGNSTCYSILGASGMLILLVATIYYLWRNHSKISNWEMLNLIIPISFVATLYLWAYDQILYILPIVWIIGTFVEKSRSYIFPIIFLVILDLYSLFALLQQATTSHDLWSLGTTILVLLFCFIAYKMKQKPAIDKLASSA